MASDRELQQLRRRCGRILKARECFGVRFRLDNVHIQRFMYTYIGQAIIDDIVHLAVGDVNAYDHESNTITFNSLDVKPASSVHEATHALINARNVSRTIPKGTYEIAAYLAEAIWALNAGAEICTDVPPLNRPLRRLASKATDYNAHHVSGSFVCPADEVRSIQEVLANTTLEMVIHRAAEQPGIDDNPSGPKVGVHLEQENYGHRVAV